MQNYDPSNHEHVMKLAKALGFTGVVMYIGEPLRGAPGLFTNEWLGTYAGKVYAVASPHHFDHETLRMQRALALEVHRVLLQLVANGDVPRWRKEPPTLDEVRAWSWWWYRAVDGGSTIGPGVLQLDVDNGIIVDTGDKSDCPGPFDPDDWGNEWALCLPPGGP